MAISNPVKKMMDATYHCVRINGLENLNLKDIGPAAGMTYQNMYNYFSGKDELVKACFTDYDVKIASLFDDYSISQEDLKNNTVSIIKKMWLTYFNFLLAHQDETIFYMQFRLSPEFPSYMPTRDESHFNHFLALIDNMDTQGILKKVNKNIVWAYVINTSIIFAKYIIDGVFRDTDEVKNQMFSLLLSGMSSLLS